MSSVAARRTVRLSPTRSPATSGIGAQSFKLLDEWTHWAEPLTDDLVRGVRIIEGVSSLEVNTPIRGLLYRPRGNVGALGGRISVLAGWLVGPHRVYFSGPGLLGVPIEYTS